MLLVAVLLQKVFTLLEGLQRENEVISKDLLIGLVLLYDDELLLWLDANSLHTLIATFGLNSFSSLSTIISNDTCPPLYLNPLKSL
jgi:hypothetical protein